jgi:DNA-binding LacI/PurR family transcriptional regulator
MDVTIKDVAKEANVAPSTVSRVIIDSPSISKKTKERVREVMERLGYYPNLQARSLVGKMTQAFGVIMPNSAYHSFQNPFFAEILRGISMQANQSEYGMYLSTSATEEKVYEEVVAMVQGKRVDGILLLYSKKHDKVMDYLEKMKFPFVVVGRPYLKEEKITFVDNDNFILTKQLTEYLIELGHSTIGFVGGNPDFIVTHDRLTGYREALKDSGITYHRDLVIHEEDMKESGMEAIEKLIKLPTSPTALVCQDDLVAYEIINHLEKLEVQVPGDMSIIGFNNLALSQHYRPPLTSVDINIFQLGYEATSNLIKRINDPTLPPEKIIVPTQLVERSSCTKKD